MFEYVVSLRVTGDTIDPETIAKQLRLHPRIVHRMGDQRSSPKGEPLGGTYSTNYCLFRLLTVQGETLSEALDRICDKFLKHSELFNYIRNSGGRCEFFIGWYSARQSGDTFSYQLLGTLGKLGIDLGLDVYGPEPPNKRRAKRKKSPSERKQPGKQ